MSFILDALKRAERDRRLERRPDLTTVYEENHPPRRGIPPWVWVSGVFLVAAIVVALILWPKGPASEAPPVSAESTKARSTSKKAPAVKPKTPPSSASPTVTAPKPPKTLPGQRPETQTAPTDRVQRPRRQPPAPDRTPQSQPAAPAKVRETPPAQASKTAAPPAKETSAPPAAPGLPTGGTEAVQPEATLPPPAREDVPIKPEAPSPPPLPADPKTEADPKKPPSIPLISELPFDVREKLGRLQINVHSYSENPDKRLVFINMQHLKVGDRIGENGPILKEITPKGVIIDYGEGQARIPVSP